MFREQMQQDDALYQVQVHEPEGALSGPAMTVPRVSPFSAELKIEISEDQIYSSRVTVEILDPNGKAIMDLQMHLRHADLEGVSRSGPQGRKASWQDSRGSYLKRWILRNVAPAELALEQGQGLSNADRLKPKRPTECADSCNRLPPSGFYKRAWHDHPQSATCSAFRSGEGPRTWPRSSTPLRQSFCEWPAI